MLLLTKYTVLYKENEICCIILLSLPSRERGLKFKLTPENYYTKEVAPFAGAWIEIRNIKKNCTVFSVAPFAGAWIEIILSKWNKFTENVAPFAGAWIEIKPQ